MKIIKKFFKFIGITLGVLLILIILIPILFGKQIKQAVKDYVNSQINAEVYFGDIGVSVFKHFPNVTVSLNDFGVSGIEEFKGDTLVDVNQLQVTINLWSVVFGDKYEVKQVGLDEPTIHAIVLADGKANWDIMKPSEETTVDTAAVDTAASTPLALALDKYWISKGNITYTDKSLPMKAKIVNLNHSGSGDFQNDNYDFDTKTTADKVSVEYDGTQYLTDAKLDVDMTVGIDLKNSRYTLKDNSFGINELVLGLDGMVEMPGNDIVMDLKFDTKRNTFGNILSMVPGIYSPDFGDMKTDGTFTLNGNVTGTYNEKKLPGFNVNLGVVNGFFQYPDLPESVKEINFDLKVKCPDGVIDNMVIDFPKFHALFGTMPIDGRLMLAGLTKQNMDIDGQLKTNMDLEKMMQMFPMEGQTLKGNFMVDATAKGKYNVDNSTFPTVNAKMGLTNGYYKSADFPSAIDKMSMNGTMTNTDGSLEHTYIDISQFHAEIDGDPIDATLKAENIDNIAYDLTAKGKLSLDKLGKIYPIEGTTMKGLLDLDLKTSGKYSDVEAGNYTKLPTSGAMKIDNLEYTSTDFPQGMKVTKGEVVFTPQRMDIKTFTGAVGKSPISITGFLENYLAYALLPDQKLKGVMSLTSIMFDVNEWMVEDEAAAAAPAPTQQAPAEGVEMSVYPVPANIDFVFTTGIQKVLYDNLTMTNVRGKLTMRNEEIKFENFGFNALDGTFNMNGFYNTKDIAKPAYNLSMNLLGLNIQKTYETFQMVQALAPTAKFVNGNFSSTLSLNGLLKGDMMPDLATLTGNGLVTLVNGKVAGMPLMEAVADKVKLANLKQFSVADTKIKFRIENGTLFVDPFDTKVGDIKMNTEGQNKLDGGIAYKMKLNFPAGKVGATAVNAVAGLTKKTIGPNDDVEVFLGIGGTALKPKITSVSSSSTDVVTDVVDDVKEQVQAKVDSVKNEVKEQVNQVVDDTKEKARAEAAKIMADAERQAAEIRRKGKESADKIRAEANKQASDIEKSAKNPIEKAAKKKLADETRKKGEESAKKVERESDQQAQAVLDAAKKKSDALLK